MIGEPPVNACCKTGIFFRIPARASRARTAASRCPVISWFIMSRPDTPNRSDTTTDSVMQASSSSFSTGSSPRCGSGPDRRGSGSGHAAAGSVPGARNWVAAFPRSVTLAGHTASSLSVLGRPGRCLTSRRWPATRPSRCFQQVEHRFPVVAVASITRATHPAR